MKQLDGRFYEEIVRNMQESIFIMTAKRAKRAKPGKNTMHI